MKKIQKILPLGLLFAPGLAFAALTNTTEFVRQVGALVNYATVVVAGIALLVFFWGLAKFIMKAGDEGAVEEGRRLMIWGVIALFVMVSVWGIIYFISNELFGYFGNSGYTAPPIPTFPRP